MTLTMVITTSRIFALNIPYGFFFFPFTPNYQFALKSDKGNRIDVKSTIEIPDNNDETGVVFMKLLMRWQKDSETIKYKFKILIDRRGNGHLVEMYDGMYIRNLDLDAPLFPSRTKNMQRIHIGEGIDLVYKEKKNSLTVKLDDNKKKTFRNIRVADLMVGNVLYKIYFARSRGLIGIKSEDETYRYTPVKSK